MDKDKKPKSKKGIPRPNKKPPAKRDTPPEKVHIQAKPHLRNRVDAKPITARDTDPDGLGVQDLRFIDEYVIDMNGTRAMQRAEPHLLYSSARVAASRKLQNPVIRKRIAQKMDEIGDQCGVTVQRVLREQAALAFSDIRACFDEHGRMLPLADLDDMTAAAISSVEVEHLYAGTGRDKVEIGYVTKVKMWDKGQASDRLMRHLGMFKQDNEQKGGELTDLIKLIQERSGKLPIKEQ
jgi:phage terminase small subunit